MVRVSAVMGVCRVLSYYWEMIPAPVVKALISRMVKELAWDSAAVNVRVAVVQVRQYGFITKLMSHVELL